MVQNFSVTLIDVLILLLLFLALYAWYILGIKHTHKKALAFILHPAVILVGFTFLAINFLHF